MDKRGIGDRLRLYSGLVLLLYVVGHLLNHALGLVSLEAMEAATAITIEPWRTAPGTVLLAGAALVHVATSLWSLYARRSLRLPAWQLAQTALGLLIPVLLVGHVLGTRMLVEVFDVDQSYALELFFLWSAYPAFGITQTITLLVVWVHACIGLHMWLRLKPWYAAEQRLAFALAILIPAAALAGFVAAGMRVRALAADQEWLETLFTTARVSPDMVPWVIDWTFVGQVGFLALFAALFLGRVARALWQARSSRPRLRYLGHDAIQIAPGMTVLEALRAAGIAHASVCGGHGRCSTCRVHIDAGGDALSPPSGVEERVLRRISAPASVRLACQIRPPPPTFASRRCCRPRRAPTTPSSARRTCAATSAPSRCCSRTCAASRGWRNRGCPMTWCSCSTATAPTWRAPSRKPAAWSTSSSAMASWPCSVSTAPSTRAAARRCAPPI